MSWGVRMVGPQAPARVSVPRRYLLDLARKFRAELSMPLILLGGITNRETMDLAMAEGFEFVAMARALLAEPDLINRIAADGASIRSLHPLQPVHADRLPVTPTTGPTAC